MRVEHQALEANLRGMEAEEGNNVSDGDTFMKRNLGEKIGSDDGVRVDLVWAKVEEAPSCGRGGVTVAKVGSFHGGGIAPGDILLRV